jgi:hypothetical protein
MKISLNTQDIEALSANARAEIVGLLTQGRAKSQESIVEETEIPEADMQGIDMEGVVNLSLKQVKTFMEAVSDKTKMGLRVIAETGPIIRAHNLTAAGILNISHFQSRTTIRVRTITRNKYAYLVGWDDWDEVDVGQGRYAVTSRTYQSLRQYFQLD